MRLTNLLKGNVIGLAGERRVDYTRGGIRYLEIMHRALLHFVFGKEPLKGQRTGKIKHASPHFSL